MKATEERTAPPERGRVGPWPPFTASPPGERGPAVPAGPALPVW